MARSAEPDLEFHPPRRHPDRTSLILRVEPVETAVGEWKYRASYPELGDVSATAPTVLDAILEAEAKLTSGTEESPA
jgi:hypothetical protein